jgi:hypothetical protein
VLNAIPDDLGATVLTPQQAPRLYAAVDVLPELWPWCGLLAVLALAGALVVSRRRLATLLIWAITAGLLGLLLVFALTVGRGALLPGLAPADEEVATIVYRIITGSLVSWTLWLVALMAGIAVLTLLILRRSPSLRHSPSSTS